MHRWRLKKVAAAAVTVCTVAAAMGAATEGAAGATAVSVRLHWAGYSMPDEGITGGEVAAFYVPAFNCKSSPKGAEMSMWGGIGGEHGTGPAAGVLIQTGLIFTCSAGSQVTTPFWEVVNGSQPIDNQPPVTYGGFGAISPGDYMVATTDPVANGSTTLSLADLTTNQSATVQPAVPDTPEAVAECVAERPSYGDGTPPPQLAFASNPPFSFDECFQSQPVKNGYAGESSYLWDIPTGQEHDLYGHTYGHQRPVTAQYAKAAQKNEYLGPTLGSYNGDVHAFSVNLQILNN